MTPQAAVIEDADDEATMAHAQSHDARVKRHAAAVDLVYGRGGVEPEGPVRCEQCRRIADGRQSYFAGALIAGFAPFGTQR